MAEELVTVPHVDLARYAGTWYEIARKPFSHEKGASNVTATYTPEGDGTVKVVNAYINEKGEAETADGVAKPVDGSNAKLDVSFMPEGLRWIPFTKGHYWIMRLDDSYHTSLVGDPDRKYLWLLHRQPHLAREHVDQWLAFARAQGYDISDIIHTPQK